MSKLNKFAVTEEEYNSAIRGCGRYALQRLFRKMTKLKRHADGSVSTAKDLEEYVFNFIQVHKNKPAVREMKGD